jgi:acyl-CoA dehydrogenase
VTRTLVVFGQGAIRCHPHAWSEVMAAESGDSRAFDKAFFGHVGHVARNFSRTVLLDLTGGRLGRSPVNGPCAPYYKRLDWASARFAILSDLSMAMIGGDLKRREEVTGRFADIISWMYLVQATLRRFEAEGRPAEDLPFLRWSADYGFAKIQSAFDGLYTNLNLPLIGWALAGPIRTWSRIVPIGSAPSDRIGSQVAMALQVPGEQRDRITSGLYIPEDATEAAGRMERTLDLITRADEVADKIKQAIKDRRLPRQKPITLLAEAEGAGVISPEEVKLVLEAEAARDDTIEVDSFTLDDYLRTSTQDRPEPNQRIVPLAS